MKKNPVVYLNHIIDCIASINKYTKGLKEKDFLGEKIVQDAVIRNFEIIGEVNQTFYIFISIIHKIIIVASLPFASGT